MKRLRSEKMIEKNKFERQMEVIDNSIKDIMDNSNVELVTKRFEKLCAVKDTEIQELKQKLTDMDVVMSRLDHDRMSYMERNDFLEDDNQRLKGENIELKENNYILELDLKKAKKSVFKFKNIAMMQIGDIEGRMERERARVRKYFKLKQQHEDLKQELTLLCKERQIIQAASKEESYKKEELFLNLTRQFVPTNVNSFKYIQKADDSTEEKNMRMISQNIYMLKPSYFNLVSQK
jgi:hypothetical protein